MGNGWSFEYVGSKEAVKTCVLEQASRIAEQFEGKPEADDIHAVVERLFVLIDECDLSKDEHGHNYNAVKVSANGSHGRTDEGISSASASFSVTRCYLA